MISRRRLLQAALATAAFPPSLLAKNLSLQADTIYLNGNVWTGSPFKPVVDAFAVKDGRFIALGKQAALATKHKKTKVVDLQGAFVTPGLIDNHTHFLMGARALNQVNLRQASTPKEFAQILAKKAEELAPGEWILGGNWDEQLWGGELPTKDWIDSVTPENPVAIARLDLHMYLLNTAALKIAGINEHTPTPAGGEIVRDKNNNPTGILKDKANQLVFDYIPKETPQRNVEAFNNGIQHGLQHGVTQCHIKAVSWECHDTLMNMRANQSFDMRFNSYVPIQDWKKLYEQVKEQGYGDDWVRWGGLKGLMDGSLGSRTAWFYQAYDDDSSTHGITVQQADKLREWTLDADRHNLRVSIHAIGDAANDTVLGIFADAIKQNGMFQPSRRFTIEHAQHLTPQALLKFAKLGVIPCVQPYHAIDDGRWAVNRIGQSRLKGTYAFHSLIEAGAKLSFGSDWPVAPLDPIAGIDAAVNRETIDGKNPDGWLPAEKITVDQALRAYTVNNAYAVNQQHAMGSIDIGKLADFVVMDQNLLTIESHLIAKTKVLQTVVDGKPRFGSL